MTIFLNNRTQYSDSLLHSLNTWYAVGLLGRNLTLGSSLVGEHWRELLGSKIVEGVVDGLSKGLLRENI